MYVVEVNGEYDVSMAALHENKWFKVLYTTLLNNICVRCLFFFFGWSSERGKTRCMKRRVDLEQ